MSDGADTDEALMLRFAGGEATAFEQLYRRHELKVWRYLERSVHNRATADELMQDVWFAVARQAIRYQPTARFTTWLFTLAHNRLVDARRTTRDCASLDADTDGEPRLLDRLAADQSVEPPARAESHEHAAALVAAVERLPAEQREAFLLQAEGELTLEEIAVATGTTFETAKSRLRYARAKLRAVLKEYA